MVKLGARALMVSTVLLVAAALAGCDISAVTLKGTVTLTGGTEPATGLVVTAFRADSETQVASSVVDSDGRFAFRESTLPDGAYKLRLGQSTWWTASVSWIDATAVAASAGSPPDVVASVGAGTVVGQVRAGGVGLAAATVEIVRLDGIDVVSTTTTDSTGAFGFDIADGEFLVRASAPGYSPTFLGDTADATDATPVTVQIGQSAVAHIDLRPAATLTGTLIEGGPVEGAVLVAVDPASGGGVGAAVSGADGRFTIANLAPGAYRLLLHNPLGAPTELGLYWTGDIGTIGLSRPTCSDPRATPGANLGGSDLSGADLRGCDLSGANLYSANLAGADLSWANLTGTDLTWATVTGTNLTNTTLTGVKSSGLVGAPVNLPRPWLLRQGSLFGPGAVVASLSLTGIDLAGADLTGADLAYANLSNANLSGARLAGANLGGATLALTNLSGADLSGADLWSVYARGANFTNTTLTATAVTNANFTEVSFGGTRSAGLVGVPAVLPAGWRVQGGHLAGPGARLPGAQLAGANLSGLNLANVDLTDADLAGADLTGVNLVGANLTRTNLAGATLTDVASGAIEGEPVALPTHWVMANQALIGPGARLASANLSGLDLSGMVLSGINLVGANLAGSDLSGTDLSGANLNGATITWTNLSGALLDGVSANGLVGPPADIPAGWQLYGASLVGREPG